MTYKELLWTEIFWVSYIKWCKFCNNNLSVVLGSKQGWASKLVNLNNKDWAPSQLLTHSQSQLSSYDVKLCQWNQSKKELGNALRVWRNLSNGKYLSNFLGAFAGGELHEIKQRQGKTEMGKEMTWRINKYILKSLEHEIAIWHEY